jgi:uncharacterized protein (TIGR02145 family)
MEILSITKLISGIMKTKTRFLIYPALLMGVLFILTFSCKKDESPTNQFPVVLTNTLTEIRETTATCSGYISLDGGSEVIARGVCWSTQPMPTIADSITMNGEGVGNFTSKLTGLILNRSYYVRAYATNLAGTSYGHIRSFTTSTNAINFNPSLTYGTMSDIDSNIYKTITIGTQTWMAENLRVTHYRNGDTIPKFPDGYRWIEDTTGAYCDYENTPKISKIYGRLYNWHAVVDTRNIAPNGWHVASLEEWDTLVMYLGGGAGIKLKERGTAHWDYPNYGTTNESGFTALPSGFRDSRFFNKLNMEARIWTCSQCDFPYSYYAWYILLDDSDKPFRDYSRKLDGFSIRCIKDN